MAKHTIRTQDGGTITLDYARSQAIKLHCTECLGWETHPQKCTATLCPLFPFRGQTLASRHSKEGE